MKSYHLYLLEKCENESKSHLNCCCGENCGGCDKGDSIWARQYYNDWKQTQSETQPTPSEECTQSDCITMLDEALKLESLLQMDQSQQVALEYLSAVAIYSHGMSGSKTCFRVHDGCDPETIGYARYLLGVGTSQPM